MHKKRSSVYYCMTERDTWLKVADELVNQNQYASNQISNVNIYSISVHWTFRK